MKTEKELMNEKYLKLVNEISKLIEADMSDTYKVKEYEKIKDDFLAFFKPIEEETEKKRKKLFGILVSDVENFIN
jgi:hypothetical protein